MVWLQVLCPLHCVGRTLAGTAKGARSSGKGAGDQELLFVLGPRWEAGAGQGLGEQEHWEWRGGRVCLGAWGLGNGETEGWAARVLVGQGDQGPGASGMEVLGSTRTGEGNFGGQKNQELTGAQWLGAWESRGTQGLGRRCSGWGARGLEALTKPNSLPTPNTHTCTNTCVCMCTYIIAHTCTHQDIHTN